MGLEYLSEIKVRLLVDGIFSIVEGYNFTITLGISFIGKRLNV